MKYITTLVLLLGLHAANAQKPSVIDTNNYYSVYSETAHITDWLRDYEVIPVIKEELEKAGYNSVYENANYQLPSKQMIVVNVYSPKGDFGFIYEGGHYGDIDKEHRKMRSYHAGPDGSEDEYVESYFTQGGIRKYTRVKRLPDNFFFIKETIYWHQYNEQAGDNPKLLTKNDVIGVLRQDIRKCIAIRQQKGK